MANFEPGTYTLVPNRHKMHEFSATVQIVWFWLCVYADEDGMCFPSRARLAKDCNKSIDSIDRAIKVLCTKKWIMKKPQYQDNSQTSNLYQLFLIPKNKIGDRKNMVPPRVDFEATPRGKNRVQN